MTIVEVTVQSLLGSSNVPPQLVGLVSQGHWNAISQSVQQAYRESHGIACAGELLCCLFFAFPCIFLCHPCIVELTATDRIRSTLYKLNNTYFNGQPVLATTRHDIISIDTSRIIQNGLIIIDSGVSNPVVQYHVQQPVVQHVFVPQQQQPVIYTSQPVYGVPQDNNKGTAAVPVAQQVVQQSEFLVVVPNGTILSHNSISCFLKLFLFVLCKVHTLVQISLWLILKGFKCWSLSRMVSSLVNR